MMVPLRPATSRRAFSLIEMLVVLGILSIVVMLSFWIVTTNNRIARDGMARSAVYAGARTARGSLEDAFKCAMGPLPVPKNGWNTLETPYPDRDPATLAASMASPNVPRGCLVVVPGLRKGTLPGGLAPVDLRCDQLFFLVDTKFGGQVPGAAKLPPFHSVVRPNTTSTQAAIWLGPVRDADEVAGEAQTWSLGMQTTLLNDQDVTFPFANAFDPTSLTPTAGARTGDDWVPFSLQSISKWMVDQSPAPGVPAPGLDATLVGAFAVPGSPAGSGRYDSVAWPAADSDPMTDDQVTAADVAGGYRMFLRNCSEVVFQVALDGNFNGLADTSNRKYDTAGGQYNDDGTHTGDLNTAPWGFGPAWMPAGRTLPARDLGGDIVWTPADRDVFTGVAGALDPRAYWPQDAQPRIVHYGYYQGPASGGPGQYWTNKWGDITPYPPVGGFQFGDNCLGTDIGLASPANDIDAYNKAMADYAALHGWDPRATRALTGTSIAPYTQSSWPTLVRMRVRLHDRPGRFSTYQDELVANGRDDDGDGGVDAAPGADGRKRDEGKAPGVWFEYMFSIPYPRMRTSGMPAPTGVAP